MAKAVAKRCDSFVGKKVDPNDFKRFQQSCIPVYQVKVSLTDKDPVSLCTLLRKWRTQ